MASRQLCDDEVSEILSFLPAKSIIKFRTLNRNFLRCSACDYFLLTQSHRTKTDSAFFTRPYFGPPNFTPLDPNAGISRESLQYLQHPKKIILGSANGLLFFSNESRSFNSLCVYNPMHPITIIHFIPPPLTGKEYYYLSCGAITVNPMSRDYKLVCLTNTPEWNSFYWCRIYISAENAWKFNRMIDGGPRNLQLEYPVICDGIMYVASDCRTYMRTNPYIVAIDIEYEVSKILSMPREIMKASDDHEVRIAKWGEKSLCLINCQDSSIFKLWMMSRDQGTISWAEMYRVSMMEIGIASPRNIPTFILINSNILIFVMDSCIYSYNIKERVLKELQKDYPSCFLTLIPYANSLRPY